MCLWQLKLDFEPSRNRILGPYLSTVQPNRFRGHSQAKPVSSWCFRVFVDSEKGLKDCLERVFGNAQTMVPDREKCERFRCGSIDFQHDLNISSRFCEADRIANNVLTNAS